MSTVINFSDRGATQPPDPTLTNPTLARLLRDCCNLIADVATDTRDVLIEKAKLFSTAEERTHLPDSQIITLTIAYLAKREERFVTYADVLSYSVDHMLRSFSDRAVFAAFADLEDLGFLKRCNVKTDRQTVGRPRENFEITSFGVVALWMAVANAQHIHECRARRAA